MQAISSTASTRILRIQTFAREEPREQVVPLCLSLLFGLGVEVRTEDKRMVQPVCAAGASEYSERFLLSWQDFVCWAVTVCAILCSFTVLSPLLQTPPPIFLLLYHFPLFSFVFPSSLFPTN